MYCSLKESIRIDIIYININIYIYICLYLEDVLNTPGVPMSMNTKAGNWYSSKEEAFPLDSLL